MLQKGVALVRVDINMFWLLFYTSRLIICCYSATGVAFTSMIADYINILDFYIHIQGSHILSMSLILAPTILTLFVTFKGRCWWSWFIDRNFIFLSWMIRWNFWICIITIIITISCLWYRSIPLGIGGNSKAVWWTNKEKEISTCQSFHIGTQTHLGNFWILYGLEVRLI